MVSTATLPLAGYHRQPLCGLETTMAHVQEFETRVRNYQNMVFSVAARIVGSVADAEDITQEVFIKACDRFADLQQSQSIGGWLKTVATNLSINHLNRYGARWRFFSEQEDEPELAAPGEKSVVRRTLPKKGLKNYPARG